MDVSANGIKLIQQFEGLRLEAYMDTGGLWTIGYGHRGNDIRPGLVITEDEAINMLDKDVTVATSAIDRLVKVALNQNQYDALTDFIFNVGTGHFGGSTLLKVLNAGNYLDASNQLLRWVRDAQSHVIPQLLKRREAERALFLLSLPEANQDQPASASTQS